MSSNAKSLAIAGPAAIAVLGAVGAVTTLVGFGAGWVLKSPEQVEVARAPTEAELDAACADEVAPVEDELTEAQSRVAQLERETAEKEGKVRDLEARIARGAEVGKEMRAELERLKGELAETQEALRVAEEEKKVLLAELTETKVELEETQVALGEARTERDEAREDALYNRWTDFLKEAQLQICDKGNRKKLGNCREEVMAALAVDARRDAFAHCIRSGQAEPVVLELEKGQDLPAYAAMLDEDVRQVRGWYVEMCDPTLPERTDAPLAEGRIPKSGPAEG